MGWSVSAAKARLSEVLGEAKRAPQVIENRGTAVAVVLSAEAYAALSKRAEAPKPSPMAQWLDETAKLKAAHDLSLEVAPRRGGRRKPPTFD